MIMPMNSENAAVKAPIDQGGISALILDDSQFDRMKIRRLFNTTGIPFYLNETDTLAALRDVLDQQDFDIVLIDYNLPESNGIDALKLVQEHPRNQHAATIMITGYDQSEIAVKAFKMGCLDYISKGQLSAERLKSTVLSAIEKAEQARAEGARVETYTEDLAQAIMSEYSSTMQPELAKIVRELRALRATMADPKSNLPADLEAIEHRCIRLWSILTKPCELKLPSQSSIRLQ